MNSGECMKIENLETLINNRNQACFIFYLDTQRELEKKLLIKRYWETMKIYHRCWRLRYYNVYCQN